MGVPDLDELGPGLRGRARTTLGWTLRPTELLLRARERHGDVFSMRVGQEAPWLVLGDPDAVRQVFTGSPEQLRAGEGNAVLRPFLGSSSVLLLDGPRHLRQRRLLLPPFHGERMAGYREEIVAITREALERLPRDRPVALAPHLQDLTLEVILRVVFGVRDAARLAPLRDALRDVLEALMTARTLVTLAALGPDRAERLGVFARRLRPVDELLRAEVRARRDAADLAERTDVLSLLLQARDEDGRGLSDDELRDELVTLLVAGHETTATTLAWAIERLVRTPGAWDALRAGGEPYAESAVREALRLRPVIPIVARRVVEPLEVAGRRVPAGAVLAPCIVLVHRREDVYPDAARYVPDRFLATTPGTYTWIPFGGGVRRCIGASFALLEATLVLRELAEAVVPVADDPRPERVVRRAIALAPRHGARVVLA